MGTAAVIRRFATALLASCLLATLAIAQNLPYYPMTARDDVPVQLTYDQVMSGSNTVYDLCFGSNPCTIAGQTQVANCTQLGLLFNWWGDSMIPSSWGDTPQGSNGENFNSDMERFQACNSTNFVFGTNVLTLTAVDEQASAYQITATTGTSGTAFVCTSSCTVPLATLGLVGTVSFSGTATITGGTTLDVTAVTQGGLYYGNLVSVTGCPAGTSVIAPATGNLTGNYTLSQTCTNGSGLTVTSANAVNVGELANIEFGGFLQVTSVSAGTSVTFANVLGNAASVKFNNIFTLLPQGIGTLAASLTQGATGATLATPVPANCQTGMMFSMVSGNNVVSNSTSRITSINTGTGVITFDNAWTYDSTFAIGANYICMVPITSGQLATIKYFMPGTPGARLIGFDTDVILPTDSVGGFNALTGSCGSGVNTVTQLVAAPANEPWGHFSSYWMYGGNFPTALNGDTSEVDFMTMRDYPAAGLWVDTPGFFNSGFPPQIYATQTPFTTTCTSPPAANLFYATEAADVYLAAPLVSSVRLSAIWGTSKVYLYLNGQFLKAENYQWSGQSWGQIQFQLPVGNLGSTGHNLSYPLNTTNFPSYQYGITRFRVQELP